MTVGAPSASERELNEDERRVLTEAHKELRKAVAAYEPVPGGEPHAGGPVPTVSTQAMHSAQERVEAAEDRLWQLRERLMGWARPSWAPRASLVSDWFSDEDADYDQVSDPARS